MPIRESLWSGNPISLFADVVVGSVFQVNPGRPTQRRRGRLHRADLLPATPAPWTFDERQGYRGNCGEPYTRGKTWNGPRSGDLVRAGGDLPPARLLHTAGSARRPKTHRHSGGRLY